jgi:hypothetical protein
LAGQLVEVYQQIKKSIPAGMDVASVEIQRDGKIVVVARRGHETVDRQINEWDELIHGEASTAVR